MSICCPSINLNNTLDVYLVTESYRNYQTHDFYHLKEVLETVGT